MPVVNRTISRALMSDLSVSKSGTDLLIKANDVTLASAVVVDATDTVTIDSTGTITGTGANDVTANKLIIQGDTSSTGTINTTINELELSQANAIDLSNTGDLIVGISNISGNSSITVTELLRTLTSTAH